MDETNRIARGPKQLTNLLIISELLVLIESKMGIAPGLIFGRYRLSLTIAV